MAFETGRGGLFIQAGPGRLASGLNLRDIYRQIDLYFFALGYIILPGTLGITHPAVYLF